MPSTTYEQHLSEWRVHATNIYHTKNSNKHKTSNNYVLTISWCNEPVFYHSDHLQFKRSTQKELELLKLYSPTRSCICVSETTMANLLQSAIYNRSLLGHHPLEGIITHIHTNPNTIITRYYKHTLTSLKQELYQETRELIMPSILLQLARGLQTITNAGFSLKPHTINEHSILLNYNYHNHLIEAVFFNLHLTPLPPLTPTPHTSIKLLAKTMHDFICDCPPNPWWKFRNTMCACPHYKFRTLIRSMMNPKQNITIKDIISTLRQRGTRGAPIELINYMEPY